MQLQLTQIPTMPGVLELAAAGMVTGASGRNWASYGQDVTLPAGISTAQRALLSDPQTSGGLLVSCAPGIEAEVLECFHRQGFAEACTIGRMVEGSGLEVLAG
jgi:selenide,water dikinase